MPLSKAAARAADVPRQDPRDDGALIADGDQIAAGLRDLASAIREGTETFRPAAETVHGFGARLDALCRWVTGKWPWVLGIGLYALQQAAPELYEAVKAAVAAIPPSS
jgi:hypothetical protein